MVDVSAVIVEGLQSNRSSCWNTQVRRQQTIDHSRTRRADKDITQPIYK